MPDHVHEFIQMTHPDVSAPAEASRQAFDEVWAPRGWEELGAKAPVDDADNPPPPDDPDLGSLRKDELIEVARSHALEPDAHATKAELIELIQSTVAPATPS